MEENPIHENKHKKEKVKEVHKEIESILDKLGEEERKTLLESLFRSNSNEEDILPDALEKNIPEIISGLPEDDQKMIASVILARSFSGPIPPPHILKGYEDVLPGSADRILRMAEEQSKHRQSLENQVIPEQLAQSRRGQYFGFSLALICLVSSSVLAFYGMTVVASILASTTIGAVVYTFVLGKKYQGKKMDNLRQENENNIEGDTSDSEVEGDLYKKELQPKGNSSPK